jgi:hypothetical protein
LEQAASRLALNLAALVSILEVIDTLQRAAYSTAVNLAAVHAVTY